MRSLFFAIMVFPISTLYAQTRSAIRYRDVIFEKVVCIKNISYRPGVEKDKYALFDLYEPAGDSLAARPLIIWIHGGGFKYGTKKSAGTPIWSRDFAKRGYLCAAINYRLSNKKPLANFPDLVAGCASAIGDVEAAVRFFRQNSARFRVDTSRIILAGNSAGGMVALQAVYASFYELAHITGTAGADSMPKTHNTAGIVAVINFWGAMFDTTWLKNGQVPVVSVHGVRDRVVRYDHGNAPLYGSMAIHRAADALKIPNSLKPYPGFGHELQRHFNPLWAGAGAKKRWHEAGAFAAGFLYSQLFNP
jgi:poly(3-hydroxybutyrate) depolymerase